MRFITLLLAVLALASLKGAPAAAQGATARPSFDCATVTDVIDQTICGNPKLAEADSVMARLFAAVRVSAFGEGPSNELAVQRKWLKQREACRDFQKQTSFKSRAECLDSYYKDRNQSLAVAALFVKPKLALATLSKLDPKAEPLYEAIFDYVARPAGEKKGIEQLLRGYMDKLVLEDAGVKQPDVLKSDRNFALFLASASARLGSDFIPPPFPCAAIVQRPALLDAEAPMFGSTMDSFTFTSDCAETLPPMPKLDALVKAIKNGWPTCDGTIRFAAYRNFDMQVDAAKLGVSDASHDARSPHLKGVNPSLVQAAIEELSRYYHAYHRGSRSLAAANVRAILAAAHQCD